MNMKVLSDDTSIKFYAGCTDFNRIVLFQNLIDLQ
jgi:hypothetical protein